MPPRRRALAIAVIAMVTALAVSVSGVLAHDRGQRLPRALPAGNFAVTGNVQKKLRLSVAGIAAMPDQRRVEVSYHAGSGTERHVFTGPLLLDVLARAVPRFDPAIKNDKLRHYVSVTASDAYQALVAYGARPELREQADPAGRHTGRRLARRPGTAARRAGRSRRRPLRDRRGEGQARQVARRR